MQKIRSYYLEIYGIIFCLALGMLSGILSNNGDSFWYITLAKPSFNPPNFVFGPVWTVIYIMIGVALGMLWRKKLQNRLVLFVFAAQFMLNLSWSPIFFYFHQIGLALIIAILLWVSIVLLIVLTYRKQRIVSYLFLPYLAWVSFAILLNFDIYLRN